MLTMTTKSGVTFENRSDWTVKMGVRIMWMSWMMIPLKGKVGRGDQSLPIRLRRSRHYLHPSKGRNCGITTRLAIWTHS